MKFNYVIVNTTEDSSKYKVSGDLTPNDTDKDVFEVLSNSYKEIFSKYELTSDNMVIKDNEIVFVDIAFDTMLNFLALLSSSLKVNIHHNISNNCKFFPESCKDLFKMEVVKANTVYGG